MKYYIEIDFEIRSIESSNRREDWNNGITILEASIRTFAYGRGKGRGGDHERDIY